MAVKQTKLRNIQTPPEWCERTGLPGESLLLERAFSPPEAPEVVLAVFYRGRAVPLTVGRALIRILEEEPHQVAPDERSQLSPLLRTFDDSQAFELLRLETMELNERRAMAIEGIWKESNIKNYAVFFACGENGTEIAEVHFAAPVDQYDRYESIALNAIDSVEWANGSGS